MKKELQLDNRYYKPEIETMPREEFLAFQWKQLQTQIRYAYENSGLCKRQFGEAKITPDDIKTREDFTNRVPYTTKHDLLTDQWENPPYGTRLAVRKDEIFATYLTGGTSGKGQEVHTATREDIDCWADAIAMMYYWAGWEKGDKAMNSLPLGITQASRLLYEGMQRLGCDVFNLGMYDTKTKLEHMKRFEISCLDVSPSYIESLAYEAERFGFDPARDFSVKKIMMAGQAYPLSFISKTEDKWQAKICDNYAATQAAMGCTCQNGPVIGNRRGYYHLFEHFALHEVIDPKTGLLVNHGEVGEMVVTPLHQMASPFLRFKLGDKVRYFPYDACDCGRPFPLLEAGTIARYDDMLKIKGVNIWPQAIDEVLLSTKDETAEYKGRVYLTKEKREEVEVSVEFKAGVTQDNKQQLISKIFKELRDITGIRFSVMEATEELPRYMMKATSLRWTDERIDGLEKKRMD